MPIDYSDHAEVLTALKADQEAEHDRREKVREIHTFLDKPDGQWEPEVVSKLNNRPRYTFDKCNAIVDQIAGEMEQASFGLGAIPVGGGANEDTANVMDGLIRNIERMSKAKEMVYNPSARNMVRAGVDGWEVGHDWADGDNFDQDLIIRKIHNFHDRVWFDCGAENQDASDSNHVFVLSALSPHEYARRWPKGSKVSIGDDRTSEVYSHKPDKVIVGNIRWKEPVTREIVLMSNGKVYEVDEDYQKIADELAEQGITETRRRKRKSFRVMSRLFDGKEWLNSPQETVFKDLPVIPVYGNFKITENKVIYWGAVEKLMDAQRVYNYLKSREIEEGALAPRRKVLMTREQAQADRDTLASMNTNADPVQLYTHVNGQPPPFETQGPQVNPVLVTSAQGIQRDIETTAGIFGPNRGEDEGMRSGVAIERLQNKGDTSTVKYFSSMSIAIQRTGEILVNAIPKVYDTRRQVRILGEDGVGEFVTVNDRVFDDESQQWVEVNNLGQGTYDVNIEISEPFKNRQQETVNAFMELSRAKPELLDAGLDVWLQNINAPGVKLIAQRIRRQMVLNGQIPDDQLTEEELQIVQAIRNQPQQPDPVAEALLMEQQISQADTMSRIEERQAKTALAQERLMMDNLQMQLKANNDELKLQLQAQSQEFAQVMETMNQVLTQAKAANELREAQGIDVITGPHAAEAMINQFDAVTEVQEQAIPGATAGTEVVNTEQ